MNPYENTDRFDVCRRICLGLPAVALESLYGGTTTVHTSDHFNNQSSIVPDTVQDKVSHTDHGQIKADRAEIPSDKAEIAAHKAHEQAQMGKDQKEDRLSTAPGQTPPIATQ